MASREEFEKLTEANVDALYRTAYGMTGEGASAEDLVQETFLRAWRGFDTFEPGTNFRAWIYRILTNTYINSYRRKVRAPVLMDFAEVEPEDPAKHAWLSSADVAALGEQLGDGAKHALEKMPPEFRVVFLLATFEEMSYKEIAGITGIPVGTVMSRLFRARKMLREELAGMLPAEKGAVGHDRSPEV
jgi:RNA polymerase sigma-70 factor (ECF subfamily)